LFLQPAKYKYDYKENYIENVGKICELLILQICIIYRICKYLSRQKMTGTFKVFSIQNIVNNVMQRYPYCYHFHYIYFSNML